MSRRVLIVTGPPASGKSALSRELAAALALPLLNKDEVKERLYETIGSGQELEPRIEEAALAILASVAGTQLDAGISVILESNFERGRDEPRLCSLAAEHGARLVQIHCRRDSNEVVEGFVERVLEGRRHPGHGDQPADAAAVRARLEAGVWDPLELPGELLELDPEDDGFDAGALAERLRRS